MHSDNRSIDEERDSDWNEGYDRRRRDRDVPHTLLYVSWRATIDRKRPRPLICEFLLGKGMRKAIDSTPIIHSVPPLDRRRNGAC